MTSITSTLKPLTTNGPSAQKSNMIQILERCCSLDPKNISIALAPNKPPFAVLHSCSHNENFNRDVLPLFTAINNIRIKDEKKDYGNTLEVELSIKSSNEFISNTSSSNILNNNNSSNPIEIHPRTSSLTSSKINDTQNQKFKIITLDEDRMHLKSIDTEITTFIEFTNRYMVVCFCLSEECSEVGALSCFNLGQYLRKF